MEVCRDDDCRTTRVHPAHPVPHRVDNEPDRHGPVDEPDPAELRVPSPVNLLGDGPTRTVDDLSPEDAERYAVQWAAWIAGLDLAHAVEFTRWHGGSVHEAVVERWQRARDQLRPTRRPGRHRAPADPTDQ